jgi:hypothetical protein
MSSEWVSEKYVRYSKNIHVSHFKIAARNAYALGIVPLVSGLALLSEMSAVVRLDFAPRSSKPR